MCLNYENLPKLKHSNSQEAVKGALCNCVKVQKPSIRSKSYFTIIVHVSTFQLGSKMLKLKCQVLTSYCSITIGIKTDSTSTAF